MNLISILAGLPFWTIILGAFLTAFLITYFSTPTIAKVSKYKGLVALPNSRTSHTEPTPNLGGIAIFAGFTVSAVVFSAIYESVLIKYILCGMVILFFLGLKDDILILDPKKKILGQLVASLIIVVLGDLRVRGFFNVFGINELPYLVSAAFTVLLFVFIIISFNFIDGIDGLASGMGIVISLFYGLWFIITGHKAFALLCFELTGALLAFFRFNVFSRKSKIFMGDAGAMITGLLIAVFTVQFLEFEKNSNLKLHTYAAPAMAIALLFIPLLDTIRVLILRVKDGNLFKGGRNHIHHLVLRVCDSHLKATTLIITCNLFFLLLAVLFQHLGNVKVVILMLFFAALFYLILLFFVKKYGKPKEPQADHSVTP